MDQKIGVIGFGTMASGMVKNLLNNKYTVVCYNRTKQKLNAIKQANFIAVDTPADAAKQAHIIVLCVSDDAALENVLFGEKGIMNSITPEHTLIDCSTTSLLMTEKIQLACVTRNAFFVDAPVTGSKLGAEGGSLLFMVGGEEKILEKVMHVFMAMGKKVIYCGENTFGQRAKLALNLTQALIFESYCEGLLFAMKNGIKKETMLEILDNSGAKNNVMSFKMPYLLKNEFEPHFKLDLMKKDILLCYDELKRLHLTFPLSQQILSVYKKANKEGLGELDYTATIKILENIAGVRLVQ